MDSVVLKDSVALFPESIASVVRAPPNTGLDLKFLLSLLLAPRRAPVQFFGDSRVLGALNYPWTQ